MGHRWNAGPVPCNNLSCGDVYSVDLSLLFLLSIDWLNAARCGGNCRRATTASPCLRWKTGTCSTPTSCWARPSWVSTASPGRIRYRPSKTLNRYTSTYPNPLTKVNWFHHRSLQELASCVFVFQFRIGVSADTGGQELGQSCQRFCQEREEEDEREISQQPPRLAQKSNNSREARWFSVNKPFSHNCFLCKYTNSINTIQYEQTTCNSIYDQI